MSEQVKKIIGKVFSELADTLETGSYGKKPNIGITALGSELGEDNAVKAAVNALKSNIDVTVIGTKADEGVKLAQVSTEEESHKMMEELLSNKEIDAAVTMHYPFPIGVSTVGRVVTPAQGKEMYIATTTGTSSTDRIEGMVKNAIYGIITAKACGIKKPTVAILNVDGARQVEIALKKLQENGYDINFAESKRADGGVVVRGNDLIMGTADVMVMDSLTGNIMMKMFSSYSTGGSYEAVGYGYGPGIGENFDKIIMIISRASGVPVVEGAIKYAAELVRGNVLAIAKEEFAKVKKAKLDDILKGLKPTKKEAASEEEVVAPPKEVVTGQISGIEIMDLEDAVQVLWKKGIYAESGMGCTGPIVLVNEAKLKTAIEKLVEAGYVSKEQLDC